MKLFCLLLSIGLLFTNCEKKGASFVGMHWTYLQAEHVEIKRIDTLCDERPALVTLNFNTFLNFKYKEAWIYNLPDSLKKIGQKIDILYSPSTRLNTDCSELRLNQIDVDVTTVYY